MKQGAIDDIDPKDVKNLIKLIAKIINDALKQNVISNKDLKFMTESLLCINLLPQKYLLGVDCTNIL